LLEGLRDVFCAGASLDFLRRLSRGEADESSWWSLPEIFLSFPMPIIGSVTGHAVGGGLLVALYCDMVVAAEESRYGFNFIDLGFTPGMGATTLLPALVGTHFANEMLLTGKLYRGRELRERSVFNRVVPAAQVDGVVLDIARSLALKPAPVLALLKEALSLPRRRALPDTLQREALMHRICFASPDTARRIDELYAR
jgi:polyketide biosynthesis enoyl-CoA hydratase PksI